MGAWGIGIFDNDDACDFVVEVESGGITVLREALSLVVELEPADYLDSTEACFALAAGALVAAARGRPIRDMPVEANQLVEELRRQVIVDDAELAARAAAVVRERDELPELWAEVEQLAEWQATVDELLGQLAAEPA